MTNTAVVNSCFDYEMCLHILAAFIIAESSVSHLLKYFFGRKI